MKNNFKFYTISWAILLAVYNLFVFLVRPLPGFEPNYDAQFWVSWIVVIVTFLGQLYCTNIAFKAKNKEKFFLKVPLITASYATLIFTIIFCSVAMLIPNFPVWAIIIVCAIILGFRAISIVKAAAAADIVDEIDDNIKVQTFFIRTLTIDAESLMARTQNDTTKAIAKKLYEAVRYSDPMSSLALSGIEEQITAKFAALTVAVTADDTDAFTTAAEEVLILIKERNNKCKQLK